MPFAYKSDKDGKEELFFSTSGGSWKYLPVNKLKYVGQEYKNFHIWGHEGVSAGGSLLFRSIVNVWEYFPENYNYHGKDGSLLTTKDFDMYDFYERKGKYSCYLKSKSFDNKDDFLAWLRTNRAEVFEKDDNSLKVFCWKEIEHHVSPEEYNAVDALEDCFICNGYRTCKRVYDNENHVIHLYFVWYWKEEPSITRTWEKISREQNTQIAKYRLDSGVVNKIARQELQETDYGYHV